MAQIVLDFYSETYKKMVEHTPIKYNGKKVYLYYALNRMTLNSDHSDWIFAAVAYENAFWVF